MNLLIASLQKIQNLIKNQQVLVITKMIEYNSGFQKETIVKNSLQYAHIQPIDSINKMVENSNLDSNVDYKFYFYNEKDLKIITSLKQNIYQSYIKWNEEFYKVYLFKDWLLNGWCYINASLTKEAVIEDSTNEILGAEND